MTIAAGLYGTSLHYFPDGNILSAPTMKEVTLTASGHIVAWVFSPPKTGNIDKIYFRIPVVNGNQDIEVSIQGVDTATGRPDGTIIGGPSTFASVTLSLVDPTDNDTFQVATLDNAGAVTAGDAGMIAIVLELKTSSVTNIIQYAHPNTAGQIGRQPYVAYYTGSWALDTVSRFNMAFRYDDETYPETDFIAPHFLQGGTNARGWGTTTASTTGIEEKGMRIKLPYDLQIAGLMGNWRWGNLAETLALNLYDSTPTQLRTVTLYDDVTSSPTGDGFRRGYWSEPYTLKANQVYYIVIEAKDSAGVILKRAGNFSGSANFTNALLGHMPGNGECYFCERTGLSGAFTTDDDLYVSLEVIPSGVHASAAPHLVNGGLVR